MFGFLVLPVVQIGETVSTCLVCMFPMSQVCCAMSQCIVQCPRCVVQCPRCVAQYTGTLRNTFVREIACCIDQAFFYYLEKNCKRQREGPTQLLLQQKSRMPLAGLVYFFVVCNCYSRNRKQLPADI